MLLAAGALAEAATGDGYQSLASGWYDSGAVIPAGGYYVTVSVVNASNVVNVIVDGPSVPDNDKAPRNVVKGSSLYYGNYLRVYVVDVDVAGNRTYIDVSQPGGGPGQAASGTKVTCDTPGLTALGGDAVTFPVTIQNNDNTDHTYTLSSFSDVSWKTYFSYGQKGVYMVSVPALQSRTVDLMVQTWANTPVGTYPVVAYVDKIRIEVHVAITSANQTADVSTDVSSKIANLGDRITYNVRIKNLQSRENVYSLAITGLPDNWYGRYKETAASAGEQAEVVVPASSEKEIVLEIVPPYSVSEGDYNFTAVVDTPDGLSVKKNLTLALKGGVGMSMSSARYAYDAQPGKPFTIMAYVTNTGHGGALTNVNVNASAPQGWVVSVSPNGVNSIKAGESQTFTIAVQPPASIVASDYEVSLKAASDQAEDQKDYRITVQTQSYIPYVGGGIILVGIAGLVLIYRKYGRR
jgi:uncharacterized membrane protein